MKYYSESLKQIYDTQEELVKAEKAEADKKAKAEIVQKERSTRAKEVEAAYKNANELMEKFIKDYGSYHTTFDNTKSCKSLFDFLLGW